MQFSASLHRRPHAAWRTATVWAALAAAATLFGWFNVQSWYPAVSVKYGVPFSRALTWELLCWNLWATIAVWIWNWKPKRPVHYVAAALLLPAMHTGILVAIKYLLSPAGTSAMARHRHTCCGAIILPASSSARSRSAWLTRAEESRASRLEAQLAQSQLNALKMLSIIC